MPELESREKFSAFISHSTSVQKLIAKQILHRKRQYMSQHKHTFNLEPLRELKNAHHRATLPQLKKANVIMYTIAAHTKKNDKKRSVKILPAFRPG